MRSHTAARGRGRVLTLLLAVMLMAPVGIGRAGATEEAVRDRVAGSTRIETAAAVAQAAHPDGSDAALLARADAFPDAVAAGGLAGALGAPVLLTDPDELSPAARDALLDLGVETVHVLGGDAAIAPAVRQGIEDAGMDWVRYAGRDRYETAALVGQQAAASGLGTLGGRTTVLLATGTTFPDALAASPVAYAGPFPVLLTSGTGLPQFTAAMLDELGPDQVVVLGGRQAVPATVVRQLRDPGFRVRRVAGPDRTATAAAIADLAVDELGLAAEEVLLARGDFFPDALAAGPYGGVRQAPLLLSPEPRRLGVAAAAWLSDRCERIGLVSAIGGPAAVDEAVLDAAEREARECGFQFVVPYFVMEARGRGTEGLVPVARRVGPDVAPLAAALRQLLAGPTPAQEAASPAIVTAIPDGTRLNGVSVEDGVATVDLSGRYDDGGGSASMFHRLAQVVHTATRFPTVDAVLFELDGEPVEVFSSEGIELDGPQTRDDYTDQLPNLFVDTPPYGGWLGNPAHMAGITSVFEAQFAYEIRDATGATVAEGFLMSSDQVLGEFDVRIPYEVATRQRGRLRVFAYSPRDGSVTDLRSYPVELTPSSG